MSRRSARKSAFFLVFQIEFHKDYEPGRQLDYLLDGNYSGEEDYLNEENDFLSEEDIEFVGDEFNGVLNNLGRIDALISGNLSGWEIDRIMKTDLAALRIAVYEILFCGDIPHSVSINEAVEIAKIYGADESYQFVNGILRNILQIAVADG